MWTGNGNLRKKTDVFKMWTINNFVYLGECLSSLVVDEVIHRGEEINLQELKCIFFMAPKVLSHLLFSFSSQIENILFSFRFLFY